MDAIILIECIFSAQDEEEEEFVDEPRHNVSSAALRREVIDEVGKSMWAPHHVLGFDFGVFEPQSSWC